MSAKKVTPMVCRNCGIEMNHHAAKIVEARTRGEAERADQALGGVVTDAHCCPGCGRTGARVRD